MTSPVSPVIDDAFPIWFRLEEMKAGSEQARHRAVVVRLDSRSKEHHMLQFVHDYERIQYGAAVAPAPHGRIDDEGDCCGGQINGFDDAPPTKAALPYRPAVIRPTVDVSHRLCFMPGKPPISPCLDHAAELAQ